MVDKIDILHPFQPIKKRYLLLKTTTLIVFILRLEELRIATTDTLSIHRNEHPPRQFTISVCGL